MASEQVEKLCSDFFATGEPLMQFIDRLLDIKREPEPSKICEDVGALQFEVWSLYGAMEGIRLAGENFDHIIEIVNRYDGVGNGLNVPSHNFADVKTGMETIKERKDGRN